MCSFWKYQTFAFDKIDELVIIYHYVSLEANIPNSIHMLAASWFFIITQLPSLFPIIPHFCILLHLLAHLLISYKFFQVDIFLFG